MVEDTTEMKNEYSIGKKTLDKSGILSLYGQETSATSWKNKNIF